MLTIKCTLICYEGYHTVCSDMQMYLYDDCLESTVNILM